METPPSWNCLLFTQNLAEPVGPSVCGNGRGGYRVVVGKGVRKQLYLGTWDPEEVGGLRPTHGSHLVIVIWTFGGKNEKKIDCSLLQTR